MTDTTTQPPRTGTVSALAAPCWTLDVPEPLDGGPLWHAGNQATARKDAIDYAADYGTPPPGIRELDRPCHIAACGCGRLFDEDGSYVHHFAIESEAREVPPRDGWTPDLRCARCVEGATR